MESNNILFLTNFFVLFVVKCVSDYAFTRIYIKQQFEQVHDQVPEYRHNAFHSLALRTPSRSSLRMRRLTTAKDTPDESRTISTAVA